MKKHNKKTAAMALYLAKFKLDIFLVLLPTLAVCGGQAGASLATAQLFQSVFQGDLHGMLRWVAALIGIWSALIGLDAVREASNSGI